jgi:protein TonB
MGRVEEGSSRVVTADHPLFAASVRTALPTYRFLPAEAEGRRVRQLVRLPFRFSLNP